MSSTPEEMNSRLSQLEAHHKSLAAAHRNLEAKVHKKFVDLDRKDQVGSIILQGKSLPRYEKNEKLFKIIQQLADKHLKIKICDLDIDYIRRITNKKSAPILIKWDLPNAQFTY